ncbi:MAG: hypothetical protein CMH57_09270, partial [Myxococcales bacterium]|nr:hypothetical protein [Myxococcales bacterium]
GGPAVGVAHTMGSSSDLTGTTFRSRPDDSSGGGFGGTGGLGGLRGNSTNVRAPSGANGCMGLEAETYDY